MRTASNTSPHRANMAAIAGKSRLRLNRKNFALEYDVSKLPEDKVDKFKEKLAEQLVPIGTSCMYYITSNAQSVQANVYYDPRVNLPNSNRFVVGDIAPVVADRAPGGKRVWEMNTEDPCAVHNITPETVSKVRHKMRASKEKGKRNRKISENTVPAWAGKLFHSERVGLSVLFLDRCLNLPLVFRAFLNVEDILYIRCTTAVECNRTLASNQDKIGYILEFPACRDVDELFMVAQSLSDGVVFDKRGNQVVLQKRPPVWVFLWDRKQLEQNPNDVYTYAICDNAFIVPSKANPFDD